MIPASSHLTISFFTTSFSWWDLTFYVSQYYYWNCLPKIILCIQKIGMILLMLDIFQAIAFIYLFRSAISWHHCLLDKSVEMITGNFYLASRYSYCKWASSCLSSNLGGIFMDEALSFNSDVISNTSSCSSIPLNGTSGPLKNLLFNDASFYNLPNSCSKLSLLLIRLLWTIFS